MEKLNSSLIKRLLKISLPIFIIILLGSFILKSMKSKNSLGQGKVLNYNDCDYYNLIKDNIDPLTDKDSINLIKYALKHNLKAKTIFPLYYLLPRIKHKLIDSLEYDNLIDDDKQKSIVFGLDWYEQINILLSNAIIIGTVVEKNNLCDNKKCLRYKTSYIIKVTSILRSTIPIKIGDLVMVKDIMGEECGCNPNNPNTKSTYTHIKEYYIGDSNVFLLNHNDYNTVFYRMKYWNKVGMYFDDEYCSNTFELPLINSNFDILNIEKIHSVMLYTKSLVKK